MIRASRRGRQDDGMSLVELMVTMMITGLIAAMTAALVIGVQRTNAENAARQDQIDGARVAVEGMSRSLRSAVKPSQVARDCTGCAQEAFLAGSSYDVQFYANIDNPDNRVGPSRVSYTIPTTGARRGELIETIQRPTSNVPTATGYAYCLPTSATCAPYITTRVIARDVVTTGTPVFTFFDLAGDRMATPAAGLPPSALAQVRSVELVVTVASPLNDGARSTTYIQRMMLPNAQAVLKSGAS
ncbi:PulJ/GspJ family protein [Sanguibacter suaedae]|uniref:Prepilin-type N-terminal cleavage/methylation domain-containing protein n=1 Tax=Sanguibacter suaedae TaxID=2795737 RepID=A0A934I525_9MICO|nr:prepilin-type N-terminal cleavage/methylation domain-containing protein [Sanguibacter suaedae]MBI9115353.1 prepilin-type N-terminal cleavage/methylation domain-containing protein [Sanguibacter suaedae]